MIWIAVAVAFTAWALLLAALAVATRNPEIKPGPPTAELAPESPAIVDLITGEWKLCDEAAAATLLDLAAKGAVGIEEVGPELALVRLRQPRHELNPYEKLVYDHVRSLAKDGVVATGALAEGSRNLQRWWKSFRKKVIVEARARGLSRPRWSRAQALLLTVTAAAPAALTGLAAEISTTDSSDSPGIGAAVIVFFALVGLMGRLNGERGTAEGARVASHWLGVRAHLAGNERFAEQPAASVTVWGRHLAYAAALGLAPRAVTSLPISTPADDKRAWSDFGGMWHVVNVRYPRRHLWGRKPGETVFRGLIAGLAVGFWVWLLGVVASAVTGWPDALVMPVAYLGAALAAGFPIVYALIDLSTKIEVRGQIIRLRAFQTGTKNDNPVYAYWVALDDGRNREVKALGIDHELWSPLAEGDLVSARIGGKLGWVHAIRLLERSRHRGAAAYDDTVEHRINAPVNLGEVRLFTEGDGSA